MNPNVSDDQKEGLQMSSESDIKFNINDTETHDRSVIIVGSKAVGKTTMVYRFLRKEDTPKQTIAMDYSFGRKAGIGFVKDTFHVWEVGHLTSTLISAAMTGSMLSHSPRNLMILLMLDLSKPEILWNVFEESISAIRSAIKMTYDEKVIAELRKHRLEENPKIADHGVDPLPLKMYIVGGRYDEFKEFDIEKKELIGRTLRAIAYILGVGLQYHSAKDATSVKKIKELLSHYGFGAQLSRATCFDYNKPLVIQAGSDSWASIKISLGSSDLSPTLDNVKQFFVSQIPQGYKEEDDSLEYPENDPNFAEPAIDRLRDQREEEISILLRNLLEGRTAEIPVPDPF